MILLSLVLLVVVVLRRLAFGLRVGGDRVA